MRRLEGEGHDESCTADVAGVELDIATHVLCQRTGYRQTDAGSVGILVELNKLGKYIFCLIGWYAYTGVLDGKSNLAWCHADNDSYACLIAGHGTLECQRVGELHGVVEQHGQCLYGRILIGMYLGGFGLALLLHLKH